MRAAHSADDNQVGSFFTRSAKGVPSSSWDSFLLKPCFQILTCLSHDTFYYGPFHYPCIFLKETEERALIHPCVFQRATGAVCPCKLAVLTSLWGWRALLLCGASALNAKLWCFGVPVWCSFAQVAPGFQSDCLTQKLCFCSRSW